MLTPPTPARRRRRDDWRRSDGGVWLPGAADVPRVAGDPMRGGMTRRGMGSGFEPAGCCCVKKLAPCTYRNFFDFEYDITISGMFNNIDGIGWLGNPPGYNDVQGADAINGTHRVTWSHQEQSYLYYLCDPPFAGGCVWKITTTDVGIVVDYKDSSSLDEVDSLTVYLMVTLTDTNKIDVMVLVMAGVYGAEQYGWGATNLSCEIECLDGLELARCDRHYGDAFGLATDPAIINVVP
jgi:hypothetical protein